MPSVPTTTSTSPLSPAAATVPRPPGPSAPVACASSTISRQPWRRASAASSASGATSPSIEKTPSVTISAAPLAGLAQPPGEVLDVAVAVDEGLGPGEPAAVDDAGVVELVGEDDLSASRERRDRAACWRGSPSRRAAPPRYPLNSASRSSSWRCGSMLPEISREAPAPTPSAAPPPPPRSRTRGWSARPR